MSKPRVGVLSPDDELRQALTADSRYQFRTVKQVADLMGLLEARGLELVVVDSDAGDASPPLYTDLDLEKIVGLAGDRVGLCFFTRSQAAAAAKLGSSESAIDERVRKFGGTSAIVDGRTQAFHALAGELERRAEDAERYHVHFSRDDTGPIPILGQSPAMAAVHRAISRATFSDTRVLLRGERGTGKDVVARALHAMHPKRSKGSWCAINAPALVTPDSINTALFGSDKGSFTGVENRVGALEQAHGGTVFFDEIGDMKPECQAVVLSVLSSGRFQRQGSTREITSDFRLIAATNLNLEELVAQGKLRADLFDRINKYTIWLPPLRERGNDIILLADHFLARWAENAKQPRKRLADPLKETMLAYPWPGNVRELETVVGNMCINCDPFSRLDLSASDFYPMAGRPAAPVVEAPFVPAKLSDVMTIAEADHIRKTLDHTRGNHTQAAKLLDIDRPQLRRKVKEYQLKQHY